jgi:hypothetical protein
MLWYKNRICLGQQDLKGSGVEWPAILYVIFFSKPGNCCQKVFL